MLSLFLFPLSQSLKGEVTGKYDYQFYDDSIYSKNGLIKTLFTKVRIDDSMKDIKEATEIDYKVAITNSRNENYVIVKQTITNNGPKEKKIDLCTAFIFNETDNFVDAYTIPNFGWSLKYSETSYNTMVLQNHPWVTNVNAQDFGLDKTPKFFTNNLTVLKLTVDDEPGINWLAFSWLNNYIKAGESKTFSYLYYDREYEPGLLFLDKSLISEEVDSTEPIHIKGSFSHYKEGDTVEADYEIYEAESDEKVAGARLGKFKVSKSQSSMDFDVLVTPPTKEGKYVLYVYTYYWFYKSYLTEVFYITVVAPNYRPKVEVIQPEYKYYLPNTEVSLTALVHDQDLGDKSLTVKIFFDSAEVASYQVPNKREFNTFKFTVPKDTKANDYEVRVTATDGKKIGTRKFMITIQDNTDLTINFEPELNSTYHKGDKVNFTAVITDRDTNFDNKFTVSLYYNNAIKSSLTLENRTGLVRVPLSFFIPTEEINTSAEVKISVKTQTESKEKSKSILIYQDVTSDRQGFGDVSKEEAKRKALIAVLCVLCVLAVILAIVIVILWIKL